MKRGLLCGILLLAAALAMQAFASSVSVHQDNGNGSLSWHDGDRALVLKSDDERGIRVVEARPEGVLGLRTSDVVLAVEGHPVKRISDMLERLHASRSASARMLVRRGGKPQSITVAVSDYKRFAPPLPPPPAPLAPSAPPAPPAPPPPPPAPAISGT